MRNNNSLKNAYTYSPEQHPNIVLGSLHLLFWFVFRPRAWENHIQRLDSSLTENFSLVQLFLKQRWKEIALWKFVFQTFLLLPMLSIIIVGILFLSLGIPVESVAPIGMVGVLVGLVFGSFLGVKDGLSSGLAAGVVFGVTFCVAYILVGDRGNGLALGISGGLAGGMAFGSANGVESDVVGILPAKGMARSIVVGVVAGLLTVVLVDVVTDVVAFAVALGVAFGVAYPMGLLVNWWRPILMSTLFMPWTLSLYYIDRIRRNPKSSALRQHIAVWDEWQFLPIRMLDKHLLLVLERNPQEGKAALNYLSTGRQRWAAKSAQIELDARQLASYDTTFAIGQSHRGFSVDELTGEASSLFRSFSRISEDVSAALNQTSLYSQRLGLTAVGDRIDSFIRELTRSNEKYAARFLPIAQRWCNIITLHLDELKKTAEQTQEIDSPYITGIPLTEREKIFVGRTNLSARIEQLLLDRRRPPLLLYGQRRMGKTSLLNNLGRLLPNNIIPLFVDLQGPAARASDHAGFLYNLAKGMRDSAQRQRNLTFPLLSREALAADPFTTFDEWLDAVETILEDGTALLSLDEFEVLDKALTDGKFNEADVLGMLRNLIQQRPKFKVMIAGSHTLQEFQRWSSYLINAQTLHLSYLTESEARQLIESPCPGFALHYEPDACKRVLSATRCHPCMVQLLCAEIVAYKNEQDPSIRRLATLADVEAAIPEALRSGSMFFSDIEANQLDARALDVLRYISVQGEGVAVSRDALVERFGGGVDEVRALLLRRELIEETDEGNRFQIELFRRWFAQPPV